MGVTQDQALSDLSFLLGETVFPATSTVPDRARFVQAALERVYRAYNWELAEINTTLTLVNGIVSAPADLDVDDPIIDMRIKKDQPGLGVGSDLIFTKVSYDDQDSFGPGDYVYWVTGTPGAYIINTDQAGDASTANAAVSFRYKQVAPAINASIQTPFPSSMALARGALAYYRQAEDPQADISQVEAFFQRELEEVIATQIRNEPDKPAKNRHSVRGTYIGDIDGGNDSLGNAT